MTMGNCTIWIQIRGFESSGSDRLKKTGLCLLLISAIMTMNHDWIAARELSSVIEDVVKTKGTTIVMITHNTQIAKMADRVVTMRNGVVSNIKKNLNPCSATDLVW